jgi:hypothetical protein
MMYVTNSDRLLLNPLFRNTTYLDFLTYLSIVNQTKVCSRSSMWDLWRTK